MTKVKLELISDADMYLLFQKGVGGRVSYISKRYSKASNKYLKSYEPKLIVYLDAKNLYCYALSKFLPTDGFKWTDHKEFDSNKYSSSCLEGCVLEVDFEYPKESWITKWISFSFQ